MGKNQQASGLTNIIHYDNNGNITFVSGSTTLMSISSSGARTTTGVISGSNVLTASYANNAELLDGLDSTAFATTGAYSATSGSLYTVSSSAYATSGSLSTASGSFNTRVSALEATGSALSSSILSVSSSAYATSGSLSATSGSLSAASGSFNTRVSALEVTGSALSSSILSVSSSAYATSGSLSTDSGSFNSRVASLETYSTNLTAKTASFATTGSNTFIGSQVVSGSLTASGSITATGTITAQTLVVQTITSSVVYSSGSNVFGNDIGNSQRFTGSVLITGSLTIAGASSATSYSGATIFGSTIACSPIGCFATSCATSFIGGTMSGTTIYGSTVACSPIGLFSGCVGIGTANPSAKLHINGGRTLAITGNENYSLGIGRESNTNAYYLGVHSTSSPNLLFSNNAGTTNMTLDYSGNLGLGVTPSAWTSWKALQINGNAVLAGYVNNTILGNNWYYDGTDRYTSNGYANIYQQGGGIHAWYNAPSGTAGCAITFTQAMTLDASGNLFVGATTSAAGKLVVKDTSSSNHIWLIGRTSDGSSSVSFRNAADSSYAARIEASPTTGLFIETNGTERMRITCTGNVLIGTSTISTAVSTNDLLTIGKSGSTSNAIIFSNGVTTNWGFIVAEACKIVLASSNNITFETGAGSTERMRLCSNGFAYFACELTAKTIGTNDLILNNLNYECANYVDGTRGSWLIQEGACDLFIINQVSCKKYKFNLTEIK